jgi:hypothetical protein
MIGSVGARVSVPCRLVELGQMSEAFCSRAHHTVLRAFNLIEADRNFSSNVFSTLSITSY